MPMEKAQKLSFKMEVDKYYSNKPYPVAWSACNTSYVDMGCSIIDSNTVITYGTSANANYRLIN